MKRLWVALAISVLVAYFCVVSAKDVNHSIQEMLDQLSVALQAVLDQDLELENQRDLRDVGPLESHRQHVYPSQRIGTHPDIAHRHG